MHRHETNWLTWSRNRETLRAWRMHTYRFPSFNGMIYWIDPPALNRPLECALETAVSRVEESSSRSDVAEKSRIYKCEMLLGW